MDGEFIQLEEKSLKDTQPTIGDTALAGVSNLLRLLPTGTLFLFQYLSPLFTNNGQCYTINKYLTGAFLTICGFSSSLTCLTDSYTGQDGIIHYGIPTMNGLWAFSDPNAESMDFSAYKLQLGDFVHAFTSLIAFAIVAVLDPNTVNCFYPSFGSSQHMLLMALPPVVGALSSTVLMLFPHNRHGIGYITTQAAEES